MSPTPFRAARLWLQMALIAILLQSALLPASLHSAANVDLAAEQPKSSTRAARPFQTPMQGGLASKAAQDIDAAADQAPAVYETLFLPHILHGAASEPILTDGAEASHPEIASTAPLSVATGVDAASTAGVEITVTKYYYFNGQRIAMKRGDEFRYLHHDHLGSTVMETDLGGNIVADQRYYAFGGQRDSDPVSIDHRFTGQELDETGLIYFNARYYDPEIGQFISPDTIVADPEDVLAYNRYMYGLGNPLRYNDPSGHIAETVWDIANIGIGTASLVYNVRQGNTIDAWVDAGGLVVDVGATVVPFVPGGLSSAIKAKRALQAAGHLGDATHLALRSENALQAAKRLRQVGSKSDEGADLIKEIARLSSNGDIAAKGNTVVLGKFIGTDNYMSYIDKAKEMGSIYFSTPADEVWNAIDEPWLINRQFLDDAVARGDKFHVEHDNIAGLISDIREADDVTHLSYLHREINYLLEQKYVWDGVNSFGRP